MNILQMLMEKHSFRNLFQVVLLRGKGVGGLGFFENPKNPNQRAPNQQINDH